MLTQTLHCAHCGSEHLYSNGHAKNGKRRYQCQDCNGELVNITSGYIHFNFNVTTNPDGGFHLDIHGNFQNASGVGAMTGANYQVVGSFCESFNTQPGAAFNITANEYYGVVSQGPLPNEKFQAVYHVTVNANGDVTAFVEHFLFTCNG